MTIAVSDRLRDALERLDQAIDRLDAAVSARPHAAAGTAPARKDDSAIARQLDLMIERIETALAT